MVTPRAGGAPQGMAQPDVPHSMPIHSLGPRPSAARTLHGGGSGSDLDGYGTAPLYGRR